MGLLDPTGKPTKGVRITDGGQIAKRNFDPGDKAALLIPSGLAINAGIGLMSPMGGAEGYEAVIPDEDNKKQSANPVLEVATKYLTWDEQVTYCHMTSFQKKGLMSAEVSTTHTKHLSMTKM